MTAIAYVRINDELLHVKYHNIKRSTRALEKFVAFLQSKFQNVYHVNYYGGVSKRFLHQQKVDKLM
jgi:hypothetical protein